MFFSRSFDNYCSSPIHSPKHTQKKRSPSSNYPRLHMYNFTIYQKRSYCLNFLFKCLEKQKQGEGNYYARTSCKCFTLSISTAETCLKISAICNHDHVPLEPGFAASRPTQATKTPLEFTTNNPRWI